MNEFLPAKQVQCVGELDLSPQSAADLGDSVPYVILQQVTAEDAETGGGVGGRWLFCESGQADRPVLGEGFRVLEPDDPETLNLLGFYLPYGDDASAVTFVRADQLFCCRLDRVDDHVGKQNDKRFPLHN